jgi:hypothetical protein
VQRNDINGFELDHVYVNVVLKNVLQIIQQMPSDVGFVMLAYGTSMLLFDGR